MWVRERERGCMRVRALAFICVSSVIYSITSSALAYLPWSSVVVGIFAFWLHSGRHFYILGLLVSLIIRFLFSLYTNARTRANTHTLYIYIYYKSTSNLHGWLTRRIVWTRAQDTTRYDFIVVPRARGTKDYTGTAGFDPMDPITDKSAGDGRVRSAASSRRDRHRRRLKSSDVDAWSCNITRGGGRR